VIEVVFFDAGETLLHPHPSFHELFAKVCAGYGVTVDAEVVRATQEKLAPHLIELAERSGVTNPSLSAEDSRKFWTFLYESLLAELGLPDHGLSQRLFEVFSSSSSYRLFDDVLEVLHELSARGYKLGLISNFERWLEEMLVELEVGHLFEWSVISGVVGVEKPDPEIYRIASEVAGVPPSRSVHVGDSYANDVRPAEAAGMRAVLLDRVGRYADKECATIESLRELPELIGAM
jgi:putative hydrolase of the HAD superfamily